MELIKLLQANKDVSDYRVSTTRRESYELFFVHRKLETVRSTATTDVDVTVYVDHDGKLGSSTFAVFDSMTEEEVAEKIASAAQRAKLIFNETWPLPDGREFEGELPSNLGDFEPKALAAKIADAVFDADDLEGGSINATEIFLYKDTLTVENSRGVKKTQVKRHAMIEAIPTWNEGDTSVELYESYTFTNFDPKEVTEEIRGKMREVRDRQHAQKPESRLSCGVVLKPKEIVQLLHVLTRDLSYTSAYGHQNLHKKGDSLQPESGCDKLTVTLRGQLPGDASSALFDADGTALTDAAVIENGVVTGGWGPVRFASYLGEKPTGDLRCAELAPGTLDMSSLTGPYLECVSLSGLQVDLYNDYIGGEIRLAYYHDGKEIKPVTGISMSGSLSGVLSSLRLSEKTASVDGYHGPDRALLQGMSVL